MAAKDPISAGFLAVLALFRGDSGSSAKGSGELKIEIRNGFHAHDSSPITQHS